MMNGNFLSKLIRQGKRARRQLSATVSSQGYSGVVRLARRVAADRLAPRVTTLQVRAQDVANSDLSKSIDHLSVPRRGSDVISLAWIVTPAAAGSGGHTTFYRILNHLEERGYRNTIYFYDVYGGDHDYYAEIARDAYNVSSEIRRYEDGIADCDGIVASSWPTAYASYASPAKGVRFYFVQDYEPYFYPASAAGLLAENTYRMGFHALTAGKWLAAKLSDDFNHSADHFPFGCDTSHYTRTNQGPRNGVAFYARASTARRGVELGILALQIFAARNPDVDIHLYGEKLDDLPFRFVNHGRVTPGQLNGIYNQCAAGLCLSLTNVSLVPFEMLACGCIPVMNDAPHNRMVLENDQIAYADASPHALAARIEEVLRDKNFAQRSHLAAQSVTDVSWDAAGEAVDAAIRAKIAQRAAALK